MQRNRTDGDDLDALVPERELVVGGVPIQFASVKTAQRAIEVREFTFRQAVRLESAVAPIVAAMHQRFGTAASLNAAMPEDAPDDPDSADQVTWSTVAEVFCEYHEQFEQLLCAATGMTPADLDALSDRDGRALLMAFMSVNWSFFVDRLVIRTATRGTIQPIEKAAAQA